MKRKLACITLSLAMALGTGVTAFAAPVAVEGGGVFDSDYYAENNLDVVAALGTDFTALWTHFTMFGVNEGRQPFAADTDVAYVLANGQVQSLEKVEVQTTSSSSSTTSTASHWYDNYPKGQWIDMGEYYFYICDTWEETYEVGGSCLNGRTEENYLWKQELLSRYPDRKVCYSGSSAEIPVFVVSATIGLPTDPGFSWPTYIWD